MLDTNADHLTATIFRPGDVLYNDSDVGDVEKDDENYDASDDVNYDSSDDETSENRTLERGTK